MYEKKEFQQLTKINLYIYDGKVVFFFKKEKKSCFLKKISYIELLKFFVKVIQHYLFNSCCKKSREIRRTSQLL